MIPENEHGGPQNDGVEKVTPFKHGIDMLDFWVVIMIPWIEIGVNNLLAGNTGD